MSRLSLVVVALLAGCVKIGDLPEYHREVAVGLQDATVDSWAEECAPRELALAQSNQTFAELGLEKHPDKTFIGRVSRGFDFLGYRFGEERIKPAQITVRKFLGRLSRLYEQKRASPDWRSALGIYVRRWWRWVTSGGVGVDPEGKPRELLTVQSWLKGLTSTPPPCCPQ